jgi:hypothetical protein
MKLSRREIEAALSKLETKKVFREGLGTIFEFYMGDRLLGAAWQSSREVPASAAGKYGYRNGKKKQLGMSYQLAMGNGPGYWIDQPNVTLAAAMVIDDFYG